MAQLSFTAIPKNTPGVPIPRCGGMYDNRMQCVRAAEYTAVNTSTEPPTPAGSYCAAHKAHLEAGIAQAPPVKVATPIENLQFSTPSGETVKVEIDGSK
jgi:hypothetical protein